MIEFFDYLFYLVYKFYLRNFYASREKRAATSSAGLIGGLQAINIIVILIFASVFIKQKGFLKEITFIFVAAFFQITSYIRYIYNKENNSIPLIEERWKQLDEPEKKRIRRLALFYVILSMLLFAGFAFYWLSKGEWRK